MTDFIDVLEQQLVAAHRGRPARRFAIPWRATIVFAGAVAAAAAVVAVVLALASPDAQRGATPPAQQTPPQTTPVHPVAPTRIAVLNGTTVTGLARGVADKLVAKGYNEPDLVTNDTTDQTRSITEVFYEDGHRTEAYGVADCLGIRFDRVRPMNANARALADRADIAVFVGADRAR